jgi:hypothetical protein
MDGQLYSNIVAVMRLPNGYQAPAPDGYTRVIHRPETQQGPPQMQSMPRSARPPMQPANPQRGAMQYPPQPQGSWSGPLPTAPAHDAGNYPQPAQPAPPIGQFPEGVTDDDIPF